MTFQGYIPFAGIIVPIVASMILPKWMALPVYALTWVLMGFLSESLIIAIRNAVLCILAIPILFAGFGILIVLPSSVINSDTAHLSTQISLSIDAVMDGVKILPFGIVPCTLIGFIINFCQKVVSGVALPK